MAFKGVHELGLLNSTLLRLGLFPVLACLDAQVILRVEVPLEDKDVAKRCRYHEVVHRIVDENISDVLSIRAWLHTLQIRSIVVLVTRVLILSKLDGARSDPSSEPFKYSRIFAIFVNVTIRSEFEEVS